MVVHDQPFAVAQLIVEAIARRYFYEFTFIVPVGSRVAADPDRARVNAAIRFFSRKCTK